LTKCFYYADAVEEWTTLNICCYDCSVEILVTISLFYY
jgi:hypothetical protein